MNQAATIVHARGTAMLRSALGVHVSGWLDDPAVAEIMLNADGRLWVDRLTAPGAGYVAQSVSLFHD